MVCTNLMYALTFDLLLGQGIIVLYIIASVMLYFLDSQGDQLQYSRHFLLKIF